MIDKDKNNLKLRKMSFSEFAGHRKYNLIEFQGKPLIENSKEFELNQNSLK